MMLWHMPEASDKDHNQLRDFRTDASWYMPQQAAKVDVQNVQS